MIEDHDQSERQLESLVDSHVNDILNASDEQILTEAKEIFGDTKKAARHINDLINRAKISVGKKRLATARSSLDNEQSARRCHAKNFSLEQKRKLIQGYAESNKEQCKSLTLAARKGGDMSESDLDCILEALIELGAIDENGNLQ